MEADSFLGADCFSRRILTKFSYNSTATSLNARTDRQLHTSQDVTLKLP
jgi:hypothetical protein